MDRGIHRITGRNLLATNMNGDVTGGEHLAKWFPTLELCPSKYCIERTFTMYQRGLKTFQKTQTNPLLELWSVYSSFVTDKYHLINFKLSFYPFFACRVSVNLDALCWLRISQRLDQAQHFRPAVGSEVIPTHSPFSLRLLDIQISSFPLATKNDT